MISPDVNLLVHAYNLGSPQHEAAKDFKLFPGVEWVNPLQPK